MYFIGRWNKDINYYSASNKTESQPYESQALSHYSALTKFSATQSKL